MMVEPIPGRQVFLRRPEPEDLDVLLDLINDPRATSSTVQNGMPVSSDRNRAHHASAGDSGSAQLAVVERSTGRTVGVTVINSIDWTTQTAEHGIKMLSSSAGRGLATDACLARNTFLFFRLGVRRLVWRSLDFNVAAQRLAVRLGYQLEGRARQAVQRDGRWCDVLTYGLLRKDAETMDDYSEYRKLIVPVDVHAVAPDFRQ